MYLILVLMLFADTTEILEKLEVLNGALRQKSSNFLHQKQAEFDKDYVDFMQDVAETRVSRKPL